MRLIYAYRSTGKNKNETAPGMRTEAKWKLTLVTCYLQVTVLDQNLGGGKGVAMRSGASHPGMGARSARVRAADAPSISGNLQFLSGKRFKIIPKNRAF